MRTLNVEFAIKRQVPVWLLALLSSALTLFAAHHGWQAWSLDRQADVAEREAAVLSARIEQDRKARREREALSRTPPPYFDDAVAVAKIAAFPLGDVLRSLESAQVQGISVTALEVSAVAGTADVELEYSEAEALTRYLDEINAGELTPRWQLRRAQARSAATAPGGTASIVSKWSGTDR